MGVKKIMLRRGNGVDIPKKHDEVSMEYTGWLFDEKKPDKKGKQFDSSIGRGDLITPIGVGRVIRGWDEGILGSATSAPMTLGEKATLTISADYGYGDKHGIFTGAGIWSQTSELQGPTIPAIFSLHRASGACTISESWTNGAPSNTYRDFDIGTRHTPQARLTKEADQKYGLMFADIISSRGFPGHIPGNAKLIFDVELKSINGKRA